VIKLTRLDDTEIVLNANLIEYVEATPDTVITMTTGRKYIVKESVDEVIKKAEEFFSRSFPIYVKKPGEEIKE